MRIRVPNCKSSEDHYICTQFRVINIYREAVVFPGELAESSLINHVEINSILIRIEYTFEIGRDDFRF